MMLFRMMMHSAIFTLLVAAGAAATNGAGLLNGNMSLGSANNSGYWQSNDGHDDRHRWKNWEHDDD